VVCQIKYYENIIILFIYVLEHSSTAGRVITNWFQLTRNHLWAIRS